MDSSSFASTLLFSGRVRLLTYIRSLFRASQHGTLMGYSRASSSRLIVLRIGPVDADERGELLLVFHLSPPGAGC